MENNNRQGCRWTKEKPEFKKECVLVTASKYNRNSEAIDYDYTIWQIKQLDGENDEGESCWYWGLLTGDGEEYGSLEDLEADYYMIIPSPESIEPCATSSEKTDFQIAWELSQTKDKPFFVDTIKKLLNAYDGEEISFSKFVEELNVAAYKWKHKSDQEELLQGFKNLQFYFALNDKTTFEHWAYSFLTTQINNHIQ